MNKKDYTNLIGKTYGSLTVVGINGNKAICECTCGNKKETLAKRFINGSYGKTSTCGECYNGIKYKEYIGKIYGSLKVIEINGNKAICECTCGNKKELPITGLEKGLYVTCNECYKGMPYSNFIGEKHGDLICIDYKKSKTVTLLQCKCLLCGTIKEIPFSPFHNGRNSTCGECYNGIKYKDYIGKTYGSLTVIEVNGAKAVCECTCGNKIECLISTLNNRKTCGECYKGKSYSSFIGKTFGTLTIKNIISSTESNYKKSKYKIAECECNNCGEKIIKPFYYFVTNRKTYCDFCHQNSKVIKISYPDNILKNYIGKRYGHLTITGIKKGGKGGVIAKCVCVCGNECERRLTYLIETKRDNFCNDCFNGKSYKDYIGKVYGYLTIKEIITKKHKKQAVCICKCGNKTTVQMNYLFNGNIVSCGCFGHKTTYLKNIKFGHLRIMKKSKNTEGGLYYICKCDCGNEIEVLESDLFTGKITCCEECKV